MSKFIVMTWNVENLFAPGEGESAPSEDTYREKIELLRAVIDERKPDVVAFQEVGGPGPLFDLQQALGSLGLPYPHRAMSAFPDGRGIRVGFLSKHAIQEQENIVDFPSLTSLQINDVDANGNALPVTRMTRGALRIRVSAPTGLAIDVITAHLKSKLLSFRRATGTSFTPRNEDERSEVAGIALLRRTAEAVTLRVRANSLLTSNQATPLVMLGDFNDVPEAQTSLILAGPPGSEVDSGGFDRPDAGDDVRLFSLAPLISADRRFSRIHHGRGELLDQILVSEELLPHDPDKRRRPEVDSLVDFRQPQALLAVGENPGARTEDIAPDHAPVMAKFDVTGIGN